MDSDASARTTATSSSEGRLMSSLLKRKKQKINLRGIDSNVYPREMNLPDTVRDMRVIQKHKTTDSIVVPKTAFDVPSVDRENDRLQRLRDQFKNKPKVI
jgi:hypothetical protein